MIWPVPMIELLNVRWHIIRVWLALALIKGAAILLPAGSAERRKFMGAIGNFIIWSKQK